MGLKYWYIMVDDNNYFYGFIDGKCITSTDEFDAHIYENKKDAYDALDRIKKIYPEAEVYISINGD